MPLDGQSAAFFGIIGGKRSDDRMPARDERNRVTGNRIGYSHCRGLGWEYVHVCIDDHSRVAFSDIKPDQSADSAVAFLKAAVAYYKGLGVGGRSAHPTIETPPDLSRLGS